MDKFVTRTPNWKAINYSTVVRNAKKIPTPKGTAAVKPLQDHKQPNRLPTTNNKSTRLSIRDETLFRLFSQPTSTVVNSPNNPMKVNGEMSESPLPLSCPLLGSLSNENVNTPTSSNINTNNNNSTFNELLYDNFANFPLQQQQEQQQLSAVPYLCSTRLLDEEDEQVISASPKHNQIKNTPKQPSQLRMFARIERDLNSPSASVRLRALKALKSPTKSAYAHFDVSINETCNSTVVAPNQEPSIDYPTPKRAPLAAPPTTTPVPTITLTPALSLEELMRNIIVYVEVRTGEDNRSEGVRKVISAMGARVNNKLLRDTTHVVFKDGLLSTYRKAKAWNIPVVSILWIEECKKHRTLCDPSKFPISNVDRYENPELYDKMKRHKSMQPDSECNKRLRIKTGNNGGSGGTPKDSSNKTAAAMKKTFVDHGTASPRNNGKTEISQYFKPITSSKVVNKNAPLNRDGSQPLQQKYTTNGDADPITPKRWEDGNTNFNFSTIHLTAPNAKTVTGTPTGRHVRNRRQSFGATSMSNTTILTIPSTMMTMTPTTLEDTPKRMMTRRRSLSLAVSENADEGVVITPKRRRIFDVNHTPIRQRGGRCGIIEPISEEDVTNIAAVSMDISNKTTSSVIRKKHGTPPSPSPLSFPKSSEQPQAQNTMTANRRRRTLYTPQNMEFSNVSPSPVVHCTPVREQIADDKTILDDNALANRAIGMGFNSAKTPHSASSRRRTMFDVSMDIISHQLQTINQSAAKSIAKDSAPAPSPAPEKEAATTANVIAGDDRNISETASSSQAPPLVRKRKLFAQNDESFSLLTPPALKKLNANNGGGGGTPITMSAAKRSRPFSQPPPMIRDECVTFNGKGTLSKKPVVPQRRRSTLDFVEKPKTTTTIEKSTVIGIINEIATSLPIPENSEDLVANDDDDENDNVAKQKEVMIQSNNWPYLVYTNMHQEQAAVVRQIVDRLGGFHLEKRVSEKTTHVISFELRRTLNMMHALIRGLWILNYSWLLDSAIAGEWLSEEQYEMRNFSRAVEICRAERQAFGEYYRCELFSELGPFFVSMHCCNTMTPKSLIELIQMCGGRVVGQHRKARYIIHGNATIRNACARHNRIGAPQSDTWPKYLSPFWVLNSITQMQLLPLDRYDKVATSQSKAEAKKAEVQPPP